jgi:hypothetical protein
MRTIKLIAFFTLVFCSIGFAQTKLPIEFRVEKQAMSTPMTALDEIFFAHYYDSKPVNIIFTGSLLNMTYDDGSTFVKKNITEVNRDLEYSGDHLTLETILFTDNSNVSDTISFVVDHTVGYVQIVLPTKMQKVKISVTHLTRNLLRKTDWLCDSKNRMQYIEITLHNQ